jgi:hypothetical protein
MASKDNNNLIIGLAVVGVAYFGLVKPLTDKLGLTQSDKDKALAALNEEAAKNPGWDPKFYKEWQKKEPVLLKTSAGVSLLAQQIYNALGTFSDNDQAIYAAFKFLKSKVQLSQLVAKYSELYKEDLLTRLRAPWYYIKDGLTDLQNSEISKIVNALPTNLTK